jgi:hypothetical protein
MEWYGMLKHKTLTGQEHGKHYCQNALVKVCLSAAVSILPFQLWFS